jgi:hypothetical protein
LLSATNVYIGVDAAALVKSLRWNRSFACAILLGLLPGQRPLSICRPGQPKSFKLFGACARLSDYDLALVADLLSLDRPIAGQSLEPRRIGFCPAAGGGYS